MVTHASGRCAHLLPVDVGRVPEGAEPGVDELSSHHVAQAHDLQRAEDGGPIGHDVAMDRARHPVEERHHPDPVAARLEEPGGRALVVLVDDPAHVVAAAVDPVAGVARPDRTQWAGQLGGRLGESGLLVGHDVVRRPATPAASQIPSASILSSRARNAAGRPNATGRPLIGWSVVTNGDANQTPRRSGSQASMAAVASGGRWRAIRSCCRTSSVIVDAGGGTIWTTSQSPGWGSDPHRGRWPLPIPGTPGRGTSRPGWCSRPAHPDPSAPAGRYRSARRAVTASRVSASLRSMQRR